MVTAENWLRPNRRALLVGTAVPLTVVLVGFALARCATTPVVLWASLFVGVLGAVLLAAILISMRSPRLGYDHGYLLVYLRAGGPIRVPVEAVECFFLGEGPSRLPYKAAQDVRAANLVVRLAEKAASWHEVGVKPTLGEWRDGYIVIRGTWCEPLSIDLVNDLNHRLAGVKRQLRDRKEQITPP